MKPPPSEVLRVAREHTCYELAEHYLLKVEGFCKLFLEALDCGIPAAKVFLIMYAYRRDWTCSELAASTSSHRQKVNVALKRLMGKGLVERVDRHRWRLSCHLFGDKM
ncbi:MAG: hypothetical protein RMJ15_04125 [Nitrososphaerota archaeon]|nr:MarR family transcriptional regulator [Candidatus Bathyarchaeota archaeon]MDW8022910.1 hypothetical protein [Nitrososphaerota archaeon]